MTYSPLVQLANMADIRKLFTAFEAPIWRARLWVNPYERRLPFMADRDTAYNSRAAQISNVIIDFVEYLRLESYAALRGAARSWMLDPADASALLVHFEGGNPPHAFASFRHGTLTGFSFGGASAGPARAYPLLAEAPSAEDSSDHLSYQRMRFGSGTVSIDNSSGTLDDLLDLFGNDLLLFRQSRDGRLALERAFFIESYELGLASADFSVKDRRSRLTFQAPSAFYSREEYPFIDESLIERVIQDAYGRCRGVPGVCVNRSQIYNPPNFVPADGFNNRFRFRFAREITAIEEVWVEQAAGAWSQVFPGLGVPGNEDGEEEFVYQDVNPHPIRILCKDALGNDLPVEVTAENMGSLPPNAGIIEIWWSQAMRDNPGHLERRNGNALPAKMTGTFVNRNTAGEIARDIMAYYGELPYEPSYFDIEGWERELSGGAQVGLFLDRAQDAFKWIERLQNGGILGFQMVISGDRLSARADDPDRAETFAIPWHEICNRGELRLEMNGELYATHAEINYNKDHALGEWMTVRDTSQREAILEIYMFEKGFYNDSLLVHEADAAEKARAALESFRRVRPIIRGIELEGLRDEMLLFATGFIDFTLPLPGQMRPVQKFMRDRQTIGRARVRVIGWKRDITRNRTCIDVMQCDFSGASEQRIARLIERVGLNISVGHGPLNEVIIRQEDPEDGS